MANTMTLVSTVTVGAGGAASIDFTSIPQTGTDLVVMCSLRASGVGTNLTFNNDNGANYSKRRLQGSGSTVSSNSASAQAYVNFIGQDATTYVANTFGNAAIYIPNYTSSTNKSVSIDGVTEDNATAAWMGLDAGLWSGTNAITSLKLASSNLDNFAQYSTASLYIIDKSGATGATVA